MTFWVCYLWCDISDILYGFLARKFRQQSAIGARLDSIADLVLAIGILVVVVNNIHLSMYLWWGFVTITCLRLISYSIGFYKYRTFLSLHILMNKVTCASIFAFSILNICFGLDFTGIIIYIVAFLSSVEEMVIMIKSKEVNCDIKSIFMR